MAYTKMPCGTCHLALADDHLDSPRSNLNVDVVIFFKMLVSKS